LSDSFATLYYGNGHSTPLTEAQFIDLLENGMDSPIGYTIPPEAPPVPIRIFFIPIVAFTKIFTPPAPLRRLLFPTPFTIVRANGKLFQGIAVHEQQVK
jgi:hypothetical protein